MNKDDKDIETLDQDQKDIQNDQKTTDENIVEEEVVEDTTVEDQDQKSAETEKKGFFKKDKKKDKKDELIEELTDKYKRTFAEFDNFRKRSEKEKSSMYEIGARDIIEKILPVVDNFERGLNA